jgi:hypothetical protein
MSGYEFECLKSDIRQNGQREPIIMHDGLILDGGNRYMACIELDIKPQLISFGGEDVTAYVLSANLHRRHLTPGQQASIVACVQDWSKAQLVGNPQLRNVAQLDTAKDRAATSGVSHRTQQMADKVAKANPELSRRVARGEISLPKAAAIIAPKPAKDENHYDPAEEALADAHETVIRLCEENQNLKDLIAVGNLPESEQSAGEIIIELRARIKVLEAKLDAVTISRDTFQSLNADIMKQCAMQKKKLDKLEAK